jgi:histidyl-tRNA synthetase
MPPTQDETERAGGTSSEAQSGMGASGAVEMLRSRGMRELGPREMARFRRVERVFLEVTAGRGYREIRTPTIEPLHLFTAAGTLSPQLLERVYSFLDWDGWSGERVVLRPDGTVPAARWLLEQGGAASEAPTRLCYVQPVYRFVPGEGDRERWQAGVELFGHGAPAGDAELLQLAVALLRALGLTPRVELAHAGIVRAAFAAAGLDATQQLAAFDRVIDGDGGVTAELAAAFPQAAPALRLLLEMEGGGAGYLANLRAALLPVLPAAGAALDELVSAAAVLDDADVQYRVRPATARNFEYYTGVTFRMSAGDAQCLAGGRYDGLAEALGGRAVPASGFGAELLRLAEIAPAADEGVPAVASGEGGR